MDQATHYCTRCKTERPVTDFSPSQLIPGRWCNPCYAKARRDKRAGRIPQRKTDNCLWCGADIRDKRSHAEYCSTSCSMKAFRSRNPNHQRKYSLKCLYGLTPEQFDGLLASQGGGCAICGDTEPRGTWNVDHCHDSQSLRGILCAPCNVGIGNLREDPAILQRAIAYLLQEPTAHVAPNAINTKRRRSPQRPA